jgi:hypothetical protein
MGEDYIERAPTPFNEKQSGKNSTAARKVEKNCSILYIFCY